MLRSIIQLGKAIAIRIRRSLHMDIYAICFSYMLISTIANTTWLYILTIYHESAKNDNTSAKCACSVGYTVRCMQSDQCAARNSSLPFAYRDKCYCSRWHTCMLITYVSHRCEIEWSLVWWRHNITDLPHYWSLSGQVDPLRGPVKWLCWFVVCLNQPLHK